MVWITLAVAAAFVQNIRFMVQKQMADTGFSAAGATYARFVWSGPAILIAMVLLLWVKDLGLPRVNGRFLLLVTVGAATQMFATICSIAMFKRRNFAVGAVFRQTEAVFAAIIGIVILSEVLPMGGWMALGVSLIGLVILAVDPDTQGYNIANKGAALGLAAGIGFGMSATCYRGASLSVATNDVVISAMTALAFAIWVQIGFLTMYFRLFERGQGLRVARAWRQSGMISLTSLVGSAFLFIAFTLQKAPYVKTVAQVELIFAALASVMVFKENIAAREVLGSSMLIASIVLLVLIGL